MSDVPQNKPPFEETEAYKSTHEVLHGSMDATLTAYNRLWSLMNNADQEADSGALYLEMQELLNAGFEARCGQLAAKFQLRRGSLRGDYNRDEL